MKIHDFTIPLFAVLGLGSAPIVAQEPAPPRLINVSAEYSDLHFVEVNDQGEPFLEEKGTMTFVGAGIHWQFASGLFTELSYRKATDTLPYRGLSQRGQFVETETELHIQDVHVLLGRNFGRTAAFIGLGSYYRERNILGAGEIRGLYEELEQTTATYGMRGTLFPTQRFQVRLEGRLWTDIDSSFYTASTEFDASSFTPGRSLSYRASAEFFFELAGGFALSVIPAYEYTQMEKSKEFPLYRNGTPLQLNQHQPKTEWETYSLTGKLSWYF